MPTARRPIDCGPVPSNGARGWPAPQPIPDGLCASRRSNGFLPESIAAWVADIAERMQCPPDFAAVTAVVALAAVIGRRIAVRPQRRSDWNEVVNLWAMIVGRPGDMKSPAMGEALKPLHQLEKAAREANGEALAAHARERELWKIRAETARARRARR